MQTVLADFIKQTPQGAEAEAILRKCVHCGFCLATCPTYGLLGDERDSPRGRIYLMKMMFEGGEVSATTQTHLDRCLTCRSCETTCPSGVAYGRLLDIGRAQVEAKVPRTLADRFMRTMLKWVLPRPALFGPGLAVGRWLRPLLPDALARKIPDKTVAGAWPTGVHHRKMILLQGCVQDALAPRINAATARVLDHLGITLIRAPQAGCCGAIAQHLGDMSAAQEAMRRNIDAWWPHIEQGAEAIVVNASGCGTMVADYGHLLQHDAAYAERAARISILFRDISQVLAAESQALARVLGNSSARGKVAFHAPCSLQHGLKINGVVENLLQSAGFELTAVPDGHLCCGSAGTYSILQAELSQRLLANKVAALNAGKPATVATANIGCLTHLQAGFAANSSTPVRHWVELLDEALSRG